MLEALFALRPVQGVLQVGQFTRTKDHSSQHPAVPGPLLGVVGKQRPIEPSSDDRSVVFGSYPGSRLVSADKSYELNPRLFGRWPSFACAQGASLTCR